MKIAHIQASNVMGARDINVHLESPIALFAGPNGTGKSSLQEAVRLALTGEFQRVDHKKELSQIVTDGAGSGFSLVEFGEFSGRFSLPKGAHEKNFTADTALAFALDPHLFVQADSAKRRTILFDLLNLSTDADAIAIRLKKKGHSDDLIERAANMLLLGFEGACADAKKKATEAKGAWRAVTGETWGSEKAKTWRAEVPAFDTAALANIEAEIAAADAEIEKLNLELGELRAEFRTAKDKRDLHARLTEQADHLERLETKLVTDTAERDSWRVRVAETKEKAGGAAQKPPLVCPHCEGHVAHVPDESGEHFTDMKLVPYVVVPRDAAAADKLVEYEKALKLMESSVANDVRDIATAKAAAENLKTLGEIPTTSDLEATGTSLSNRLDAIKLSRKNLDDKAVAMRGARDAAAAAVKRTDDAGKHHADVTAWAKLAEDLSPEGLQSEIVREAIGPINERLQKSAIATSWKQPRIGDDMSITADGRGYRLLSESEQWRVDALITEALMHVSAMRLLVLDRMDVLDLQGRADLIDWLQGLAESGEIETALLFATLKGPIQIAGVDCFWIDKGIGKTASDALAERLPKAA